MDGTSGERNACATKDAQHIVGYALQLLLAHGGSIDLEKQARSALQVEAEHDVALRE